MALLGCRVESPSHRRTVRAACSQSLSCDHSTLHQTPPDPTRGIRLLGDQALKGCIKTPTALADCTGEHRWTRLSVDMRLLPSYVRTSTYSSVAPEAPLAIGINP